MAEINDTYDIIEAIKRIEKELMESMVRNLDHHRAEEVKEGIRWSQWQVAQLKALEQYKIRNSKKYSTVFKDINAQIDVLISLQRQAGAADQEIAILESIKKGFPAKRVSKGMVTEFFKLNDRKINALIEATKNDMKNGQTAILRMANDKYRQVIFNAQMYAASGATYKQAVDMATKDYLAAGINCIEYQNGARHTLSEYADMALRTAQKRAYLTGEGEMRAEWGISTVIMNKRLSPCPKCLPFVGKVLIDDVWSNGKPSDGPYPLMSNAVARGLYHPRCRDSHTTYFPGISTPPDDTFTKKEVKNITEQQKNINDYQYAKRQEGKYERLANGSLDEENKRKYVKKRDEWQERAQGLEKSKGVRENTQMMNDEDDYLQSKIIYDKEFEHLRKLEIENNKLMDDYMDAIDTPDADRLEKLFNMSYENLESARELLKDLKLSLSGKEAKAVRHIEKNLAIKAGIPLDRIKMNGMPYDSAKTVYESYKKVINKYPELKGNLDGFRYTKDYTQKAYAGCKTITGRIEAHGAFGNYDKLIKMYANDVEKKYHPIGTDYRSIIVHELGHALDGYMTKKRLVDAEFNRYGVIRTTSTTVKDMTLKFLGFDKHKIETELKSQGLTLSQRHVILDQKEKEFITKHISKYAAKNEKEFFAESFAEFIMSDNPREAAKLVGEIIDTALGR